MKKEMFWGLWVLFFSILTAIFVVVYEQAYLVPVVQEDGYLKLVERQDVPPGNIHFGPGLYHGPNDGWYKTEAGEWQRVEDGADVGFPVQDIPADLRGARGGKPGTWTFTADGAGETVEGAEAIAAAEAYECALQIDTDGGGEICIEPDGSVRLRGAIPNKYGEFWRGVAREWTSFERTMCRERLIRQLSGDTIPWQEPDQ